MERTEDPMTGVNSRPSIVTYTRKITILCIALLALSLIALTIVSKYLEQRERAAEMRESYEELQKNITSREVERLIDSINRRRANLRDKAVERAKRRVNQAHTIAENIYNQYQGKKDDQTIVELILAALRPVRFDEGNGYYFIFTLDGQTLHQTNLPDRRLRPDSPAKSQESQATFKRLIDIVQQQEEGVHEYLWPKPGDPDNDYKKISYVKLFEPYDLLLGTGLYLENLEEELKKELKEEITQARFGDNGYFFINNFEGRVLAHGAEDEMVGTSIWAYEDPQGNQVFQQLRKAVQKPGGGFTHYWWKMPETGAERPKIAFAKAIPDWNWLIGTGLYVDNVEADIAVMQSELKRQSLREIAFILLISGTIVGLLYILIGSMFRALRKDIVFFEKCFGLAAQQDISIDEDKIRFGEFHNIALNVNDMLREKQEFLKNLDKDKQQLATTLDSITDGVLATNREYEVVLANKVAEEMLNCPAAEALHRPLPDVVSFNDDESGDRVPCPLQEALEQQSPYVLPEHIHLINREGRRFNIELVAAPIIDREGHQQGLIVVFRDITDELKVREERIRLEKLESIGVLAGGIAHDFNNLLTSLIGNIDLAKSNIDPEHRAARHITRAESAIESAKQLANQFLTFSKGGEPIKQVVSLREELVAAAEFNLRGSNVQLQTEVAEDLLPVEADLNQINQVVSNLVINAQQAMPDGGRIHLKAVNQGGESILITIKDEGDGIPEDIREKIFEPYFTTKGSGNGLGLASCHSIIRRHGGSISVQSEPGEGSCFTIRLPVSEKARSTTSFSPAPEESADTESLSARVLVLDDMGAIREVLKSVLEQHDCEVGEARNGEEALERYTRAMHSGHPYDLVITDLTIPGERGGEAIAANILRMNPNAKIIASSGYTDSPIIAHYRDYGFKSYLLKPFRVATLVETLREVLDER